MNEWIVFAWPKGGRGSRRQRMLGIWKHLSIKFLTVAIASLARVATAAEISLVPTGTEMTLVVIQGEIENGDAENFLQITKDLQHASVLLESPGGALMDGLEIGRAIRRAGYFTGVAPNTACASACALAWLGGKTRYMDPSALVGFHAAYTEIGGKVVQSSVANALVGAYLNELGFGTEAIVFATSAAPEDMNWLNAAQARRSGIDVVLLASGGAETRIARGQALKLPSGFRWIVLESSSSLSNLRYARAADQIVRTQNGYLASVLGPFERSVAEQILIGTTDMPQDAYLSSGNGFLFTLE